MGVWAKPVVRSPLAREKFLRVPWVLGHTSGEECFRNDFPASGWLQHADILSFFKVKLKSFKLTWMTELWIFIFLPPVIMLHTLFSNSYGIKGISVCVGFTNKELVQLTLRDSDDDKWWRQWSSPLRDFPWCDDISECVGWLVITVILSRLAFLADWPFSPLTKMFIQQVREIKTRPQNCCQAW
jgi:hypothetical protein